MPAVQLSYVSVDMYTYLNTGTFGSKSFTRIKTRDVKIGVAIGEADVSDVTTEELTEPTMRAREFTWDMIPDATDAIYTALRTAMMNRAPVELAFARGPIGTGGTVATGGTANVEYSAITCKIYQFDENRPMKGEVVTSIKAKPCKLIVTNAPIENQLVA